MEAPVYTALAERWQDQAGLARLAERAERRLREHPHGDLTRWRDALSRLPPVEPSADLDRPDPRLGATAPDLQGLGETLMDLHPWRKGPLVLGGIRIDTEWRSDWKWERVTPYIDLGGARVLDIGCGNGYFGLRMLGAGAELVVGVDPTLLFVMQYLVCRHFGGDLPNYVLPLGIEDLPEGLGGWDAVFSMGVLYHRRNPMRHLRRLRRLLKTGGTLVLETLVLPISRPGDLLVPDGRYARMRNVWAIPGTDRLLGWVNEAGFENARLVDMRPTTTSEQRSTPWMTFESLEQALEPGDGSRTIEGLPAPVRAVIVATA
ncbi:MAG: tRNA 5-methoxyuridine(34)/uridine 5-oxyacetic acid(34) synthase CmoB [Xanthomonadales bacterium]|nr:tRNA 5-methoxyuridine(34)/uridine 5-oxyacetic acid(34) synthase CmoB [Gammaproteobacteria bacterium]NNL05683.1 tRNA 5-methoxyuridine(34)/uridine 5-oxyacetic acid(34) synthase CmoB [Xanthomonadales bacterium]